MARGHVEILALARQRAGLRDDRCAHEDRVAELLVIRHRFLHSAVRVEAKVGGFARGGDVTLVVRAPRELREDDVPAENERARLREAVLRSVDIRLDDMAHIVDLSEPDSGDQRDRPDVPRWIEVVAIVLGELLCELARRARGAALELPVSVGRGHVRRA
jgi:hypothetical protein